MAAALFSSPPSLSPLPPNLPNIGGHQFGPSRRRRRRGCSQFSKSNLVIASSSSMPGSSTTFQRRDLVLFGVSTSAAVLFPSQDLRAEAELNEDAKLALLVDDINAYSFLYPIELPAKKFTFKWVDSRKPERYSSVAPLSPNARQCIVSERLDIINNLVISVSIGPPNSRFLTSIDKNTWKAKDVADSVLSDKSALPVTTDQRMVENSVLDAHSSRVDGELYWYYEYLVRKSPTKAAQESNLYRHNVASTTKRDGYLYSLNASTLSKKWDYVLICRTEAEKCLIETSINSIYVRMKDIDNEIS